MRELTVRIRFTSPSIGNVKKRGKGDAKYYLPRHPDGRITFLAAWHQNNLRTAAQLMNRHQKIVKDILWDIFVDGCPPKDGTQWYRRYYNAKGEKRRFVRHECFPTGHIVGINCAIPTDITDDEMLQLMGAAGRYCGLSPWSPREFGHFEVVTIRPRRSNVPTGPVTEAVEEVLDKDKDDDGESQEKSPPALTS
jgi:hypothetical protein